MSAKSAKGHAEAVNSNGHAEAVNSNGHAEAVNSNDQPTTVGSTTNAIVEAVERIAAQFGSFKAGDLSISSLADLLDQMVRAVEQIISGRNQGALKHAELIAAFSQLDSRYRLIDKIDLAIKLPFYLEPIDGPVIRLMIDVLIKGAVTLANKHGW